MDVTDNVPGYAEFIQLHSMSQRYLLATNVSTRITTLAVHYNNWYTDFDQILDKMLQPHNFPMMSKPIESHLHTYQN